MGEIFRAGVGAVIRGRDGAVLVFQRRGEGGSFQYPQGGIEDGEAPVDAVWREVAEESGLTAGHLTLSDEHAEWLAYELPVEARSSKTGRGQVQRWFVFDLRDEFIDAPPIDLGGGGAGREFIGWEWVTPGLAAEHAVAFRRPVYRRLAAWLRELEPAGEGA